MDKNTNKALLEETFYKKIVKGLQNATAEFIYPTDGATVANGTIDIAWKAPENVENPDGVKVGYFKLIDRWKD